MNRPSVAKDFFLLLRVVYAMRRLRLEHVSCIYNVAYTIYQIWAARQKVEPAGWHSIRERASYVDVLEVAFTTCHLMWRSASLSMRKPEGSA